MPPSKARERAAGVSVHYRTGTDFGVLCLCFVSELCIGIRLRIAYDVFRTRLSSKLYVLLSDFYIHEKCFRVLPLFVSC